MFLMQLRFDNSRKVQITEDLLNTRTKVDFKLILFITFSCLFFLFFQVNVNCNQSVF